MEPTRTSSGQRLAIGKFWMRCAGDLPDPVYRDLVSTLFSMRAVIVGFGALYVIVGALIYSKWHDVGIAALTVSAIAVTVARVMLISAYDRAGGSAQPVAGLRRWERRYEILTYLFALLLSGINIRVLMEHEPLVHISTISLVFTFGAGIVSRNAGRPRLCVIGRAHV